MSMPTINARLTIHFETEMRKYESILRYREISYEIPFLSFPAHWLVRIIYPSNGATVRFLVAHKDNPSFTVSVYLDCHGQLGCMDECYWEIYPNVDGDTSRFIMQEHEQEMLAEIEASLNSRLNGA